MKAYESVLEKYYAPAKTVDFWGKWRLYKDDPDAEMELERELYRLIESGDDLYVDFFAEDDKIYCTVEGSVEPQVRYAIIEEMEGWGERCD